MPLKFELYRGRRGLQLRAQWRWRLKAKNGRIIAHSGEGYANRADAMNAINLIRNNAADAPIFPATFPHV